MSEPQDVVISSARRLSGTHNDFVVSLGLVGRPTHVVVQAAYVPKSFYLLEADDSFTVTYSGIPVPISLTAGNYSLETLAASLNEVFVAAGLGAVTASVDTPGLVDRGHLYFESDAETSFTFASDADDALAKAMGFASGETYAFAAGVVYTLESAHVCDLQLESSIIICSDLVSGGILQPLFEAADVPAYGAIRWQNAVGFASAKRISAGDTVGRFYLTDENLRPIHDLNQVAWSCWLTFLTLDESIAPVPRGPGTASEAMAEKLPLAL